MTQGETSDNIMFKKLDQKKLSEKKQQVNWAIKHFVAWNLNQTNKLIKAVSVWVVKHLGLKKPKKEKKEDQLWKRPIKRDIKELKKHINKCKREKKAGVEGKTE